MRDFVIDISILELRGNDPNDWELVSRFTEEASDETLVKDTVKISAEMAEKIREYLEEVHECVPEEVKDGVFACTECGRNMTQEVIDERAI